MRPSFEGPPSASTASPAVVAGGRRLSQQLQMPPVSTTPGPSPYLNPGYSDEDLDNDEACMVFWKEHVRPLSIYFEDTWDDARFDAAVEVFKGLTKAKGLDCEGFVLRLNTTWEGVRAKYKAGPPEFARPGWRSPSLGHRFALEKLLPNLCPLTYDERANAIREGGDWNWSNRSDGGVHKVVVLEWWASWCEGCFESFPVMSLVQKTYGSLLEVIAINDEHVFPSRPRPSSSHRRAAIKERVHEFLKDRWSEIDGGWTFKVFEDPDNIVTDNIFHKVGAPFVPNVFIFINSHLFWQGEPDIQDPQIRFRESLEEAVGIAGGVREPPSWFAHALTAPVGGGPRPDLAGVFSDEDEYDEDEDSDYDESESGSEDDDGRKRPEGEVDDDDLRGTVKAHSSPPTSVGSPSVSSLVHKLSETELGKTAVEA